jgi:hypothetical protein
MITMKVAHFQFSLNKQEPVVEEYFLGENTRHCSDAP